MAVLQCTPRANLVIACIRGRPVASIVLAAWSKNWSTVAISDGAIVTRWPGVGKRTILQIHSAISDHDAFRTRPHGAWLESKGLEASHQGIRSTSSTDGSDGF